jgi:hypothetical protein
MQYKKPEPFITKELCKFGCGNVAKYKNGNGHLLCENSHNKCPNVRLANSTSVKNNYLSTGRDQQAVYKKLSDETKDRMKWNKGNVSADFSLNGSGNHKGVLIKNRGHLCENCGLSEWMNHPITLELEHVDGNNRNNIETNLKLLCPNCHALTYTWRGRNINSGVMKVSDADLISALSRSKSIRQALLLVGLSAKGGNYVRCNDLIHKGLVELGYTLGSSPTMATI